MLPVLQPLVIGSAIYGITIGGPSIKDLFNLHLTGKKKITVRASEAMPKRKPIKIMFLKDGFCCWIMISHIITARSNVKRFSVKKDPVLIINAGLSVTSNPERIAVVKPKIRKAIRKTILAIFAYLAYIINFVVYNYNTMVLFRINRLCHQVFKMYVIVNCLS